MGTLTIDARCKANLKAVVACGWSGAIQWATAPVAPIVIVVDVDDGDDQFEAVRGDGPTQYVSTPALTPYTTVSLCWWFEDANGQASLDTSAVVMLAIAAGEPGAVIRQELADIIGAAGISGLWVYTDDWGVPAPLYGTPPMRASFPMLEIGDWKPGEERAAGGRYMQSTLSIDLTLHAVSHKPAETKAKLLETDRLMRVAVNAVGNLNCASLGVLDRSWRWKTGEVEVDLEDEDIPWYTLVDTLSVPVIQ